MICGRSDAGERNESGMAFRGASSISLTPDSSEDSRRMNGLNKAAENETSANVLKLLDSEILKVKIQHLDPILIVVSELKVLGFFFLHEADDWSGTIIFFQILIDV